MSDEVGADFRLFLDQYRKDIEEVKSSMHKVTGVVETETGKMNDSFKLMGTSMVAYFGFDAIKQLGQELLTVRGEFEQLSIAFETMLGSKAKADELMAKIAKLAATTPFSLTEVASGAKQLIAYGESSTTVTNTLKRLGDVASGVSTDIGGLVAVYGKAMTKGKADTEIVNQFAERGVPIYRELASIFQVTTAEIPKMIEQGKVGFPQLQQVIKNLTDEGGMFFNLMDKQSASITGMISNLGDAFDQMFNQIGEEKPGRYKRCNFGSY